MKRITLSADEVLIREATRRAAREGTTLNDLFRAWLAQYVTQAPARDQYEDLMVRLDHVRSDSRYSPEQIHERR